MTMIKHQSEVDIIFVSSFYDWPLMGVCRYDGKTYKFQREPMVEDDYSEYFNLQKLSFFERLHKWWKRTLFGICVGFHCHYKNNKRWQKYYSMRRPRWFWQILFKLYYGL